MVQEEAGPVEIYRSYPGRPSFAGEARRDLRAFCRRHGFTEADTDDATIALGELLVLVCQPTGRSMNSFRLAASAYPDRLEVEVEVGQPTFVQQTPVWSAALEPLAPRGLGTLIIRRLVNALTLSKSGKRAGFIKRRSS